jgi:hypothetical protein
MTRAHLIATLAAQLEAADRSAAHFVSSADVYVTRAAELLHEAEALCAGDRAADARAETDTARLDWLEESKGARIDFYAVEQRWRLSALPIDDDVWADTLRDAIDAAMGVEGET